ncbi:MAG: homoserine dehydrogenase [Actinomycetes bacterium]
MPSSNLTMNVGLLGGGVVGGSVYRLANSQAADLAARTGVKLAVTRVAVRSLDKARDIPAEVLTTDAQSIVDDPSIDIVIELMGGIEPARSLILSALKSGKSVITANKALLAEDGPTLFKVARDNGVDIYYEASVAGAIPLLRPIRESLAGDQITRVMGIVNGTTNFILTKMDEDGSSFDQVLAEAQALGYAEADPTADIEAFDAAAKAAILASLAFHSRVTVDDVSREGITHISAADIASAHAMNHVIKLLAIAELLPDNRLAVRVHPTLIPRSHPLAAVRDAFNAVFVEARAAGEVMFYGRGAGGLPTASAVLGDLVAVVRNRAANTTGSQESAYAERSVAPLSDTLTRYHVRLEVSDRPGVLAAVAQIFAKHSVSIQIVRQGGRGDDAELVIVSHLASEANLAATVDELRSMEVVRDVASVLRVIGGTA